MNLGFARFLHHRDKHEVSLDLLFVSPITHKEVVISGLVTARLVPVEVHSVQEVN